MIALALGRQDWFTRGEVLESVDSVTDPTSVAGVGETLSSLVRRELVTKHLISGRMHYRLTDHGRATVCALSNCRVYV